MSAATFVELGAREEGTPAERNRVTLAVVLSIGAVLLIATISTLIFLHLRRKKKEKVEDARWHNDRDDDNELYDMSHIGGLSQGQRQQQKQQQGQ
ncbi:hypothetical protein N3K66_005936 [Trichothecium roseum]|uniref:Uncharacterized protein n=1 Tax=Trichothecium roseum TaxID=47278 RepID=A0ACC0V131_9HYPO|nr:hypothetical protein N3K66_005936 [Trichothecium roseum]